VSPCGCSHTMGFKHVGCLKQRYAASGFPTPTECHQCGEMYRGATAVSLAQYALDNISLATGQHQSMAHRLRVANLKIELAYALQTLQEWDEATALLESTLPVLSAVPKTHGTSAPRQQEDVLRRLAQIHHFRGHFDAAMQYRRREFECCRRRYGPSHERTLRAHIDLALAAQAQGNVKEFLHEIRRASAFLDKIKQTPPVVLLMVTALRCYAGGLRDEQNNFDAARALYSRALNLCEAHLDSQHEEEVQTQLELGLLCAWEGGVEEAERLLQLSSLAYRSMNTSRNEFIVQTAVGPTKRETSLKHVHILGLIGRLKKVLGYEQVGNADLQAALRALHQRSREGDAAAREWSTKFMAWSTERVDPPTAQNHQRRVRRISLDHRELNLVAHNNSKSLSSQGSLSRTSSSAELSQGSLTGANSFGPSSAENLSKYPAGQAALTTPALTLAYSGSPASVSSRSPAGSLSPPVTFAAGVY